MKGVLIGATSRIFGKSKSPVRYGETVQSVNLGKNQGNKNNKKYVEVKRKARETMYQIICEEDRNRFADVSRKVVQKCAVLNNAKRMVKNSRYNISEQCIRNGDGVF